MVQVPASKQQRHGRIPPGAIGSVLLLVVAALLWSSITAWVAAARYSTPVKATYGQFAQATPQSGWYTVTGCMADVRKAVYWDENGVCIDVYAPVVPVHGRPSTNLDLYVEIDDPRTLSAMIDMNHARRRGGEPAAQEFMRQNGDRFIQVRDFSGLVSHGHRDPIGEWAKAGVDAGSITFIADGWRPNLALAYGGTGAGTVLLLLALLDIARGIRHRRPGG